MKDLGCCVWSQSSALKTSIWPDGPPVNRSICWRLVYSTAMLFAVCRPRRPRVSNSHHERPVCWSFPKHRLIYGPHAVVMILIDVNLFPARPRQDAFDRGHDHVDEWSRQSLTTSTLKTKLILVAESVCTFLPSENGPHDLQHGWDCATRRRNFRTRG